MSDSFSVARKISIGRQADLARINGFVSEEAADVLQVIDRYVSNDRAVKAGCDLFRVGDRGDAIYKFVHGWVALYNLQEDGRRHILQFAFPGAVLAFVPAPNGVMNFSAQALTDTVVCITSHEKLNHISRDNPEIGMRLAGLISQDRSRAFDQLSTLGRCTARERVAYLLLGLFVRSRMRWPRRNSEEMFLPLTQEHIGDATGLTAVHVNRVLRELRKEEIIEFHYRRLVIIDSEKLVAVTGITPLVALSWLQDRFPNKKAGYH